MQATADGNVFDTIRDKFVELGDRCESGCSQLAGSEARLRTLLATRRDLIASPGSSHPLSEEISRRTRDVVAILTERQKRRGRIEAALRKSLAERGRLSSELRHLEARINERTARIENLEAKLAVEWSKDPRYVGLQSHLRDLERRPSEPPPGRQAAEGPGQPDRKPSRLAKLAAVFGFGRVPSRTRRSSTASDSRPAPSRGSTQDVSEKIQQVRDEIQRVEHVVREREGFAALEAQRAGLVSRKRELLKTEKSNRDRCGRYFQEWRELQRSQEEELRQALLKLDRCLQSPAGAPAWRGHDRAELRLSELSPLIDATRLENERLDRNCDRTFTALQRVMDVEARLWRGTEPTLSAGIDFEQLLGDVALEARPPTKPAEAPPTCDQPPPSEPERPAQDGRRFRQIRLWGDV